MIRGAEGRNRTTDTRIFSPLLYRLSYLGSNGRASYIWKGISVNEFPGASGYAFSYSRNLRVASWGGLSSPPLNRGFPGRLESLPHKTEWLHVRRAVARGRHFLR